MGVMRVATEAYRLPFQRTITTARGAFTHRVGWILRLTMEDGAVGVGDCAPWPGFGSSIAAVHTFLHDDAALARAVHEPEACPVPEVRSALMTAIADISARRAGLTMARFLDARSSNSAPVYKLVQDAIEAEEAMTAGFDTVKVKVGAADVDDDVARVFAIRRAIGNDAGLRLDANAAWTVTEAVRALTAMTDARIDLIEQPVATIDGLREVRLATGVRVAADESVTDAESIERIVERRAADLVVLKPAFLGGPAATVRLAAQAQEQGIGTIVTHALESAVGRALALHVACVIMPQLAAGLVNVLADDIAELDAPVLGCIHVPPQFGLGVIPANPSIASPVPTWGRRREERA
ncbi:MAG: o-succinylbenzoate synthase [Clostridia bacterium]|nr:o-succinylbenzoate synthase [Deltaproteobacteria bacterium]